MSCYPSPAAPTAADIAEQSYREQDQQDDDDEPHSPGLYTDAQAGEPVFTERKPTRRSRCNYAGRRARSDGRHSRQIKGPNAYSVGPVATGVAGSS
jgi:hypothetical protein